MKYLVNVTVSCAVEASDQDEAHDKALIAVMNENRFGGLPDCIQIADAEVIKEIKVGERNENNAE